MKNLYHCFVFLFSCFFVFWGCDYSENFEQGSVEVQEQSKVSLKVVECKTVADCQQRYVCEKLGEAYFMMGQDCINNKCVWGKYSSCQEGCYKDHCAEFLDYSCENSADCGSFCEEVGSSFINYHDGFCYNGACIYKKSKCPSSCSQGYCKL